MGKGEHLGELEQLVLLGVLALGDDAYGMRVRQLLEHEAGRVVSVPTIYSALDRLEAKGLITTRIGDATPERGGRGKKLVRVKPAGITALRDTRIVLDRMWSLPGVASRIR